MTLENWRERCGNLKIVLLGNCVFFDKFNYCNNFAKFGMVLWSNQSPTTKPSQTSQILTTVDPPKLLLIILLKLRVFLWIFSEKKWNEEELRKKLIAKTKA
jgi:hypothetical protein